MSEIKLQAKNRKKETKVKKLLSESRVPWVIYWPKSKNIMIDFDYQEFRKALFSAKKWKIVSIDVEWKNIDVLIKNFDLDNIYDTYTHVDFIAIDQKTPIIAEIPLTVTWTSPAVILWWVVRQVIDSIKIKCLPSKLPEKFEVDLSTLEHFKSVIKIWDIKIEKWITLLSSEDIIAISVLVPRSVAATAPAWIVETSTEAKPE